MDLIRCRICGSEYNRHALAACPCPERHAFRRSFNQETGLDYHSYYAVSPDGDEELRERHYFLPERRLVQWWDQGQIVHEHLEAYPEI